MNQFGKQFIIGFLAIFVIASSCTRPANYHGSLMDAIQKKETGTHSTKPDENKIVTHPDEKPLNNKKNTYTKKIALCQIPDRIRVLLYNNKKFPFVRFTDKYIVYNRNDDLLYKKIRGHISFNQHHDLPFAQFFTKGNIILGKNHYQGRLFLVKVENNWQIYLEMDIEDYIKGVIPYEMSPTWPLEALKAQAIAARTYSVYHILQNPKSPYHVDSSINYQVFRGISGQTKRTNQAVAETKGQIIVFDNLPIPAFFHSHSGGKTEHGANVWPAGKFAFTQVRSDAYGTKSPVKNWSMTVDALTFMEFLQNEYKISQVHSFFVVKRTSSGRVKSFRLIGSQNGKKITQEIEGNRFRLAFGAMKLKSLLLSMEQITKDGKLMIHFKGKGYGHGVGMSQWGAKEMADMGRKAQEILGYYYKDIAFWTMPDKDIIAFH